MAGKGMDHALYADLLKGARVL